MWRGNFCLTLLSANCELYVELAAYIPGESLKVILEVVTIKRNGKLLPVIEPQSFSPQSVTLIIYTGDSRYTRGLRSWESPRITKTCTKGNV
jgi:hypothetical protein